MCVTDRHDMTLAVKVALNPNTTNQPSTGVRKPGNTVMSVTDCNDMTLAVKVALNPNTSNQPSTGVRKPGNTVMCVTYRHDKTLAVKVPLNLNTTNQSSVCPLPSYSFQNEVQVARLLYPLFTFCLILKHIFTTSDQHLDLASQKKKRRFSFLQYSPYFYT